MDIQVPIATLDHDLEDDFQHILGNKMINIFIFSNFLHIRGSNANIHHSGFRSGSIKNIYLDLVPIIVRPNILVFSVQFRFETLVHIHSMLFLFLCVMFVINSMILKVMILKNSVGLAKNVH